MNHIIPNQQHNDNETVLVALPIQILQQTSQQHSLVVEQNLIFKTLPDGTLIIDTNQFLNRNNNVTETSHAEANENVEKSKDNVEQMLLSIGNKTELNVTYNHFDVTSNSLSENKNTQDSTKKPGRPRKDGTKLKLCDKNESFKCKYCDKEFHKWILCKRHEKSHQNENKYKCSSCSASYNILSNYLLHLATHNTNDPTCPECGKKFQRIASLKAHLVHHEKEETFYCEECDISFHNEIEINDHQKGHGRERRLETDTLKCKHCQLTFSAQLDYKKHMSEHNKMRSILQVPSRKKPRKTSNNDRKHQCIICNKSFQKQSQIERHMRVHSGEKPYVCKICDRGFSQKGSLQIHMTKHTGMRPHKCALCPAKFSQKGNLRAHILKTHSVPHGGDNVFSCSECSCVFKRLGSLNGHMTRNHPKQKSNDIKTVMSQLVAMQNNIAPVDNDILQQAIIRSELPDVQNSEKDNKDNTPVVTYVTLADLGLDGTMRRYIIKQRRVNDIRYYLCSFCTKEFKKPSDLVRHLRVHTREKPYKCKLCLRSFAVKSTLTTHVKTHTKIKKVQCKFCYKYFSSINSLNMHIRKHTGQKPHKCSICSKAFRSIVLLKQHFQIHLANEKNTLYTHEPNSDVIMQQPIHVTSKGLQPVNIPLKKRPLAESGSKSRPYKCITCTAAFRKLSHLKQHHLLHTGERPFRCHLCFRNFFSSGILKSHLLTHNGTKPYKCVLCEKNFATNGSLRRHQEAHSNARPYLCPYCYKNFKSVLSCRRHMKIHKLEVNLQLQAAKECGITNSDLIHQKPSELPYPPDLSDTLGEDPFPLIQTVTTHHEINEQKTQTVDDIHASSQMITQTLRADETGTIVLPIIANEENFTQENIRQIEDTLNSQMISIIGSENFVDNSTYENKINPLDTIATTDELVNTLTGIENTAKAVDDNSFFYPHVIVNLHQDSEQIPIFDNTGIDNILSQVKLQNDPLFLADLNSLNINESNNVLLPFQMSSQSDLQQNQMILLPSDIEQEMPPTIINPQVNLETMDPNLQLKINVMNGFVHTSQNITDTNIVLENAAIQANNEFLDSEENIVKETIPVPTKLVQNSGLTDNVTNAGHVTSVLQSHVITDEIEVECSLCKLLFKSRTEMRLHECLNLVSVDGSRSNNAYNTEEKQYIVTNVSSGSNENLKEYIEETNKNEESLNRREATANKITYRNQCSYCPKSFRKPSDLQRHIRTHTGERPYKCVECAKTFSLKSTLESHNKIHIGKKEFTCHVCNCFFATKGSLSVHMRLHTGVKPYKCSLCQLRFRTSGHRKAHITVHFKEALRTGKIPGDIVTRKAKMSELINGVQEILKANIPEKLGENKENPSINDEIPLTIEDDVPVEQSLVGNLNLDEMSPVENVILESGDNTVMQFVHTDEEGQIININPTTSNMLIVNVSMENQIISSQLEFDDKTRMQIENLIRENTAQNNSNEIKKQIKRTCNVCQKEFSTKYLLDRHSKIHTQNKSFSCTLCTKTFNQKNALDAHMRTHLGTRPYSCPHCSNTFSQSGNLKTHIKRIHGNNLKLNQTVSKNDMSTSDELYTSLTR